MPSAIPKTALKRTEITIPPSTKNVCCRTSCRWGSTTTYIPAEGLLLGNLALEGAELVVDHLPDDVIALQSSSNRTVYKRKRHHGQSQHTVEARKIGARSAILVLVPRFYFSRVRDFGPQYSSSSRSVEDNGMFS